MSSTDSGLLLVNSVYYYKLLALILCVAEITVALEEDNMLLNVESNSDIHWNTYSPGNI